MHLEEFRGSNGQDIRVRVDTEGELNAFDAGITEPRLFQFLRMGDSISLKTSISAIRRRRVEDRFPGYLQTSRPLLKKIGKNLSRSEVYVDDLEEGLDRQAVATTIKDFLEA